MSPCGCQAACGCNIVGDGVMRVGDTFFITTTPQNVFVQQSNPGALAYPYVWWELDAFDNLVTVWIYTP